MIVLLVLAVLINVDLFEGCFTEVRLMVRVCK